MCGETVEKAGLSRFERVWRADIFPQTNDAKS